MEVGSYNFMGISDILDGPGWDAVFRKRKVKTFRIHFVLRWWAKMLPFNRDEYVDVKLESPCFPTLDGVIIGFDRLGRKRHIMKWKSVKLLTAEADATLENE